MEGALSCKKDDRILTVRDLVDYLQMHRTTIYRLVREGKLPAFRIPNNNDLRFSQKAIDRWIAARSRALGAQVARAKRRRR